jgi:hypothetical protein
MDAKDKLRIRFFGDVHYSAAGCDRDLFHSVLDRWAADNDNAVYISMGDLSDFASYSEREVMTSGKIHDSSEILLDEMVGTHMKSIVQRCEFMRGKFVGAIEGNHTWRFCSGQFEGLSFDKAFAAQMGGSWLGGLGFATIGRLVDNSHKNASVTVVAHHGKAGGQTLGNSLNQVDKMTNKYEGDIFAMGHNHQLSGNHGFVRLGPIAPRDATEPCEGMGLRQRSTYLVRTGSFLKAYEDDISAYPVDAMYPAAQLGAIEVSVEFRRVRRGSEDRINKFYDSKVYQ